MKFKTLDLIAYGPFTDHSFDFSSGPRSFHLVYGPNESGKSTCLRAIRCLLFGFPTRIDDNYLHAYSKLRVGATIVAPDGTELPLIRRKNGKTKLFGADDTTPVNESSLTQLLGQIDENTFSNRFGLSHEQLVIGGQAVLESKGDLGGILFAAGAGVGQLQAVQSQLEEDRKQIFGVRAKNTTINALLNELKEKRKELRETQTLPAEYRELKERLAEAVSRAESLSNRLLVCRRRIEQLQSFQKTVEVVPVWRRQRARLDELGDVPLLDEDFAARRREASATQQHQQKHVAELRTALAELNEQIKASPLDTSILKYEDEIVSLFQEISARAVAARDQEENLVRRVNTINRHLREHFQDLDLDIAPDASTEAIDEVVSKLHVSDAARVRIDELAGEYKQLREKERDEHERLATLRRRLSDVEDELEQTPAAGDSGMLDAVLADIGAPDSILDSVSQRQIECDELSAECQRLLTQLKLNELDPKTLSNLQTPTLEQVDEHEAKLESCSRDAESAKSTLDRLESDRRDVLNTLKRLQSQHRLPTEDELAEQRQSRDETIAELAEATKKPDEITRLVTELRRRVFSADQVVDLIRAHHQQVATRARAESELASLQEQIESAKLHVEACDRAFVDANHQWRALWQHCHVDVASPRVMRSWLANHHLFLDRQQSLGQSQSRLQAAQSQIRRVKGRLVSAIELAHSALPVTAGGGNRGAEGFSEMEFEAVYDLAVQLKQEQNESAKNLDLLRRKRQEISDELPSAEARYQASVAKRENWDAEWRRATESIAGNQGDSPGVINARLQKINKIREEKRERDILLGRIKSIDNDAEAFSQRVAKVMETLGFELAPELDSGQKAQELHDHLLAARAAKTQLEQWIRQRDGIQAELAQKMESLGLATAQLADMCAEAKVEDVQELPAREALSGERRKTLDEFLAAEKQLTMIAGTEPLDDFAKRVESQDPAEAALELNRLEAELADLEPQSRTAQQELGAIKRELDEIDGGDRAAELNQSIQFLTGRIEREAQEFAKLKIASMILQRSIEHYRRENESPVLKIACNAFARLTCGRYTGLTPEYEDNGKSTLKGVMRRPDGGESLVAVEHMSLGTADALFLALRYASLKHQLSNGLPIPVVIDDCLIQLDDERTIAALKLLSELSETTQVILFTHHEHLVALAKKHLAKKEVHLHRIGANEENTGSVLEPKKESPTEPESTQAGLF